MQLVENCNAGGNEYQASLQSVDTKFNVVSAVADNVFVWFNYQLESGRQQDYHAQSHSDTHCIPIKSRTCWATLKL